MNINLKAPNVGPWLHGLAVFLITDGLPILEFFQDWLAGDPANWDMNRFLIGLAATAVTVLISAGRNQGGVTLSTAEGNVVKGVQGAGGQVVMAPARDVVPTNERVLILRDPPAPEPPIPPAVARDEPAKPEPE